MFLGFLGHPAKTSACPPSAKDGFDQQQIIAHSLTSSLEHGYKRRQTAVTLLHYGNWDKTLVFSWT